MADRPDGPDGPVKTSQRLARPELPRRFYKEVTVGEDAAGFGILLDGKPVRTPGRKPLAVADRAVADRLAAEWAAQGERIDPATMPLTRLVHSAVDHVAGAMAAVRAEIVKYAGSDLVCYRADGPASLVAAQAAAWDPVVAWAREKLGARFILSEGIVHVRQDPAAIAAVDRALAGLDPLRLAAASTVTTLTGSALIALMLLSGAASPEEAWKAAHVDEDWQASHWGSDAAATARRAGRWDEMRAAALALGRPSAD